MKETGLKAWNRELERWLTRQATTTKEIGKTTSATAKESCTGSPVTKSTRGIGLTTCKAASALTSGSIKALQTNFSAIDTLDTGLMVCVTAKEPSIIQMGASTRVTGKRTSNKALACSLSKTAPNTPGLLKKTGWSTESSQLDPRHRHWKRVRLTRIHRKQKLVWLLKKRWNKTHLSAFSTSPIWQSTRKTQLKWRRKSRTSCWGTTVSWKVGIICTQGRLKPPRVKSHLAWLSAKFGASCETAK